MAVTPIAWNDAAWADLTGYTIAPAAEALRLAIVERATAVGESIPSILSSAVATGGLPTAAWAAAVDDLLDALIPQFTNTTIAAPFAAWDEAAILTAIGAGSRVKVAGAGYIFRAAWAQQVRAILNELLTHEGSLAYSTGSARGVTGVDGRSFADTVTAFNAAAWGSAGPGPVGHYAYAEAGFFMIKRTRRSYTGTVADGAAYELWAEVSGSLADVNTNPNGDTFEDNDHGWSEGWNLAYSGTGDGTLSTWTFGDFGDATVTEPAPDSGRGWRLGTHIPLKLFVSPAFTYAP